MTALGLTRRIARLEANRAIERLSNTPMTVADLLAGRPSCSLEALVRASYEIETTGGNQ
jgi:hypothetical protein